MPSLFSPLSLSLCLGVLLLQWGCSSDDANHEGATAIEAAGSGAAGSVESGGSTAESGGGAPRGEGGAAEQGGAGAAVEEARGCALGGSDEVGHYCICGPKVSSSLKECSSFACCGLSKKDDGLCTCSDQSYLDLNGVSCGELYAEVLDSCQ